MHKIVYLPKARQDISDIIRYIAYNLHAPQAAKNLLDSMDAAISLVAEFPEMYKVYAPTESLKCPYRMIPVKNYAIFYVVIENTIEVRRVVYAKMNLDSLGLSDE